MENVIEKDKYLIYNDEYKILLFKSVMSTDFEHFSIPGTILTGYEKDSTGVFNDLIKNLLIDEDKICYMGTEISEKIVYNSQNNKLKKDKLKSIRNYYSCYKKFSDEDYRKVIELCYKKGFMPYLYSIDELKKLIEYKKINYKKFDIDSCMGNSLDELDKRLKYIKY